MKNKVSLITGVAGTIGSNLAIKLISQKHYVYGIDNFCLGKKKNLNKIIDNKKFKLINCDLSEIENLNKIKKIFSRKIDFLWLLAANSDIRLGIKNRFIDQNNTFLSTVNSLKFFSRFLKKKSKVFFSSSSAVYGDSRKKLNEKIIKYFPISNYGENKLLSELYIKSFCKKKKIQYVISRFPNVVGKPFTHGIIFDLAFKLRRNKFLKVLGNGSQKKPYVHVTELIEAIIFLMKRKNKFNLYLLGPKDSGISVKKISFLIKKIFNSNKKIIFQKQSFGWIGDVPKYSYNTKRLNDEGYEFKNSSYKAIKLAIEERFKNAGNK